MTWTAAETVFAKQMVIEARTSSHPFPGFAAAEAFLESAKWDSPDGMSGLAEKTKDVFGLKEPSWWKGQVFDEQTDEVINGIKKRVDAIWPIFNTFADAFDARIRVLNDLNMFTIYGEALSAKDGYEFVRLVSASWVAPGAYTDIKAHPVFNFPSGTYQFDKTRWSSAPNRASEVLLVHDRHLDIFELKEDEIIRTKNEMVEVRTAYEAEKAIGPSPEYLKEVREKIDEASNAVQTTGDSTLLDDLDKGAKDGSL